MANVDFQLGDLVEMDKTVLYWESAQQTNAGPVYGEEMALPSACGGAPVYGFVVEITSLMASFPCTGEGTIIGVFVSSVGKTLYTNRRFVKRV